MEIKFEFGKSAILTELPPSCHFASILLPANPSRRPYIPLTLMPGNESCKLTWGSCRRTYIALTLMSGKESCKLTWGACRRTYIALTLMAGNNPVN